MVQRHQNSGQTRRIVPPMPKRNAPIYMNINEMLGRKQAHKVSLFVRTTALWKTCTSVQVLDRAKLAP